ncbi:MAG: T9SS type A sorting domain-containing protein [Bacteroidetes bacterium]|nr:T9SS type A sorting domain-containing protein [Bacteroidota bacterium]
MYGQLLFESQISNSETVLETELPNGIYIVTMEIAGKNYAVQVALNR